MIRRMVVALLAVLVIGVAGFAGPYFEVEQNPIALETSFVVGYDFTSHYMVPGDPVVWPQKPLFSVAGDLHATNDNVWVYPTPWAFGGFFSIGNPWVDFKLGTDLQLDPSAWPTYVGLDLWETTLTVTGYPSPFVTVYGAMTFAYEHISGPVWAWAIDPVIGIKCHW